MSTQKIHFLGEKRKIIFQIFLLSGLKYLLYKMWALTCENMSGGIMPMGKAQISLPIHVVWSRPSLSANRIIGYCRMCEWRAKACILLRTCAGLSESVHFVHVWKHCFAWSGLYEECVYKPDLLPITYKCIQLQLQLLCNFMITDYNYNYIFPEYNQL